MLDHIFPHCHVCYERQQMLLTCICIIYALCCSNMDDWIITWRAGRQVFLLKWLSSVSILSSLNKDDFLLFCAQICALLCLHFIPVLILDRSWNAASKDEQLNIHFVFKKWFLPYIELVCKCIFFQEPNSFFLPPAEGIVHLLLRQCSQYHLLKQIKKK